jgi:preprotein translocase subunit SecB
MADEQNTQSKNPEFEILRVYNKDISLETPNVPEIFQMEWKPETKLDLDVKYKEIDAEKKVYEVVLRVTITSELGDKVAFVCEVNQAGLFHIANIPNEQLDGFLNAFIPNILFPYAREVISSLVNKATFPPLNLAPLNFDAIYMQRKQQASAASQQA